MSRHSSFSRSLSRTVAGTLVVAFGLLASSNAFARGYGIFLEYGRDMATDGGDLGAFLSGAGLSPGFFDQNEVAVGFATDSNLAKDELLNFRTDLGFHAALFADPTASAVAVNGYGGLLNWALGFGVVREEAMRLWIGPNARMNVDWFEGSGLFSGVDVVDLQFGVGPMVGLNLHSSARSSVALTFAYNYKWGWYFLPAAAGLGSVSHRDHYLGLNVAIFWRSGDDKFQ